MFERIALKALPLVPKSVVRSVASRYVAGTKINDALNTVRALNEKSVRATVDILGEDSTGEEADGVLAQYMEIAKRINDQGLDSGISVKSSHFAAREAQAEAFDRIKNLVKYCEGLGIFVRLDMESSSITDLTLDYYFRLAKEFGNVGVVIQAYLKRSALDMEKLADVRANVRLCKGIYTESPAIAYKSGDEITANYLNLAQSYLGSKGFLGIATHDRKIIGEMGTFIEKQQISTDRFEFQSLLGVPIDDIMMEMVKKGRSWRVYVPYGEAWYDYSMRRLKENPQIAAYVIKHILGGKT